MYEINQFNFFEVTSEPLPLFDEYYDPVIITKPRFPRIFPEQAVVKSNWNFHASVFKEWKEDTEVGFDLTLLNFVIYGLEIDGQVLRY